MIAALALLLMTQTQQWPQHSMDRPRPPVVDPGPERPSAPAPKDAIVLFDGSNLSQWRAQDSTAAKWIIRDGYVEVKAGTGMLVSARGFGDVQLHIEWRTPTPPQGEGQERGNAIYGENPPLVNATRPPGQWQAYDVIFHRPHFKADSSLESRARMTVFLNGVLIQDNFELVGPTANQARPPYRAHPDKLPLKLQDHGNPVRYRNIWIIELE